MATLGKRKCLLFPHQKQNNLCHHKIQSTSFGWKNCLLCNYQQWVDMNLLRICREIKTAEVSWLANFSLSLKQDQVTQRQQNALHFVTVFHPIKQQSFRTVIIIQWASSTYFLIWIHQNTFKTSVHFGILCRKIKIL